MVFTGAIIEATPLPKLKTRSEFHYDKIES